MKTVHEQLEELAEKHKDDPLTLDGFEIDKDDPKLLYGMLILCSTGQIEAHEEDI